MSIPACRPRLKALFAPASSRPRRSAGRRGHVFRSDSHSMRAQNLAMTAERLPISTDAPRRSLDTAIARASDWLLSRQREDGHWVFELEADATISAEYILLQHYLGTVDREVERRIVTYLRRTQAEHGGWSLMHGGAFDISTSDKAYCLLKAAGESADAPHMARAGAAIRAHGGARRCNVFTRILLALWGEVPWRAGPVVPVEIMLLQ